MNESVVMVPAACSASYQWPYWYYTTVNNLCSSKTSMTLQSFSMTYVIFHDFQDLENGLPKFHDLPRPRGTL